MMLKETLKKIAVSQKEDLQSMELGVKREAFKNIDFKAPHVTILSGVRRCGKSTLLRQLIKGAGNFYYFNFEDPKAMGFEVADFERLEEVFKEEFGKSVFYFFDEIQNVEGWERFVRKLQDTGKKVIITGSNASLLSRELGTRLTGRHITYELFPFSYSEMLILTSQRSSAASFQEYMKYGGFPEFLKYRKKEMLQELLNDIVLRDIASRHSIREVKILRELATYFLTNTGKEFSYSKLAKQFNLGSINTMISYLSYFEDNYMLFTVPKFDYSYRKQIANPKKIYSIDTGFSNVNSASFSEDIGRVLENIVFLSLRRNNKNIYYFKGEKECDFIVAKGGKPSMAIQVCSNLTEENKEREIAGLQEAMEKLGIKEGIIVTINQKDRISGLEIKPAHEFLISPSNHRY